MSGAWWIRACLLATLGAAPAWAQETALPEAPPAQNDGPAAQVAAANGQELPLKETPRRLLSDEWGIVRSLAHLRTRDLKWVLPLAGAAAAAFATDTHVMRSVVTHDPGTEDAMDTASGAVRDLFIAAPIALFGAGEISSRERPRGTGLLAGEAMINAYVTSEAIKYVTWRERPALNDARGHFWADDAASDPSFVSGHAIVAWSSAAALAGEYSKPWQQATLYTLAGGVSVTRVLAQQHFPSDVLLGSACGWLIGHYVYRKHRTARCRRPPALKRAEGSGRVEAA